MGKKYIPLEKRTKKEQQEYHSRFRKTWGSLNPITRAPQNPKVYDRKKNRPEVDDDSVSVF